MPEQGGTRVPGPTHCVEIVEYETGAVVRRSWANSERRAERIDRGANINLNHERFYTRIVPADEAEHV